MSRVKRSGFLAVMIGLSACVTINVYFPAAAAEKAADRIIEDVWGQDDVEAPTGGAAGESGALLQQDSASRLLARMLLDLVAPAAHAAEANLNVSTPAIKQIEQRMQGRFSKLQPFFGSGAVGLTRNGMLAARDLKAVNAKQRNTVKKLVADDNADREALYREIAVANGHPEWEQQIRETFARRWIANARAGWWYQDAGGAWSQR